MKEIAKNILKWINGLSTYVKVISTLVIMASTIYGGIKIYNSKIIKKHDVLIVKVIKEKQIDDLIKSDSIKSIEDKVFQATIITRLNTIDKSIQDQVRISGALKVVLSDHIIKTATKEDIQNMFNEFELKKNGNSSFLTPYKQGDFLIQWTLK